MYQSSPSPQRAFMYLRMRSRTVGHTFSWIYRHVGTCSRCWYVIAISNPIGVIFFCSPHFSPKALIGIHYQSPPLQSPLPKSLIHYAWGLISCQYGIYHEYMDGGFVCVLSPPGDKFQATDHPATMLKQSYTNVRSIIQIFLTEQNKVKLTLMSRYAGFRRGESSPWIPLAYDTDYCTHWQLEMSASHTARTDGNYWDSAQNLCWTYPHVTNIPDDWNDIRRTCNNDSGNHRSRSQHHMVIQM